MGTLNIGKKSLGRYPSMLVVKTTMAKNLGGWMPGYSRRNPEIHVQMISNVTRSLIPFNRVEPYQQKSWFQKAGQQIGGWLVTGIRTLSGVT